MVLKKTKQKLATLYDAFKSKGTATIHPDHVEQILDKIDRKERKILAALDHATDQAALDKLERKRAVIAEQRKRGEELLRLVQDDTD